MRGELFGMNAENTMNDDSRGGVPSKCAHCNSPMSAPVVCDYCKSLNPIPAMTDYFALLGVERDFEIDESELHHKFLQLNRHAHPDYHTGDSPEVQQLSLSVSAAINDAYRTLKEPASRAGYLLELLGGKSSAEDKSVPDGFLPTMMMMQEEIADARQSGHEHELSHLREVLQTQHAGLLRGITRLFADHADAAPCEAVRTEQLDEIRKQINAVSYVRKLLSQIT